MPNDTEEAQRHEQFREQIIRLHFPVAMQGDWTPETREQVIRSYAGIPRDSATGQLASAMLEEVGQETRDILLHDIARGMLFRGAVAPSLSQAIDALPGSEKTDLIHMDTLIDSYVFSQALIDDSREEGEVMLEDMNLRIVDIQTFKMRTYGKVAQLKQCVDDIAVATERSEEWYAFSQHSKRTMRLMLWLLESFRHPVTWGSLEREEREALEAPCRQVVQDLFQEAGIKEIETRVPWLFAFLPLYIKKHDTFPPWT